MVAKLVRDSCENSCKLLLCIFARYWFYANRLWESATLLLLRIAQHILCIGLGLAMRLVQPTYSLWRRKSAKSQHFAGYYATTNGTQRARWVDSTKPKLWAEDNCDGLGDDFAALPLSLTSSSTTLVTQLFPLRHLNLNVCQPILSDVAHRICGFIRLVFVTHLQAEPNAFNSATGSWIFSATDAVSYEPGHEQNAPNFRKCLQFRWPTSTFTFFYSYELFDESKCSLLQLSLTHTLDLDRWTNTNFVSHLLVVQLPALARLYEFVKNLPDWKLPIRVSWPCIWLHSSLSFCRFVAFCCFARRRPADGLHTRHLG